jgi:hypothetical protein
VGFGVSFKLLEIGADQFFAAVSALERNRLCQLFPSIIWNVGKHCDRDPFCRNT